MRLASVRVDRYGPLAGVEHEFDGGLEVCYGPNESGKTLLLDALLRLCSADTVDVVPDVGRVEEAPVGHAVLETGAGGEPTAAADAGSDLPSDGGPAALEEHVLGDGAALDDVTDVTPRQLRNVFVVRDADLRLGDEHDFYDATARRLADLHTAEIEALRDRIVEAGRLTPTTLNLSDADRYGDAATVRDDAAELAADVRAYVANSRESGIESAERERVEVAAELERTRRALDRQEIAETLATYDRLSEQLAVVREATETLADRDCTEAGLDRLDEIDAELQRIADDLADCEDRREALREERRDLEATLADLEAELGPFEDRLAALESLERSLERFRDERPAPADGATIRLAGGVAIAAALGAGGAAVAGLLSVAGGLAVLAAIGAGWGLRRHRAVAAERARRRSLLTEARDAGLDVDAIGDVAPTIRAVRDEHARLEDRLDTIEGDVALADRRLEDVERDREDAIERRRELRRERRELLREAGVPDVEAYREAVEATESLATDRRRAIASLTERLDDRAGDDSDGRAGAATDGQAEVPMDDRIAYWADELEELRGGASGTDAGVTAEEFDPDERDRLADAVDELEDRLADLEARLDAHEDAIDRFVDETGALPTGRFRDDPIGLEARSVDGLAATARELEALVDELDRDADVSRVALAALEDVRADEEAKLAELFGPESTTTETFRAITDGRYEAVTYDPDRQTLTVDRADGTSLTPRRLSRGTTDQLYLAARIGLADRLLPGESGFLLLDDPLLPADAERLEAGFEALRSLADAGWQVVYWTAKPEVGEALVDRFDVPCRLFERLE